MCWDFLYYNWTRECVRMTIVHAVDTVSVKRMIIVVSTLSITKIESFEQVFTASCFAACWLMLCFRAFRCDIKSFSFLCFLSIIFVGGDLRGNESTNEKLEKKRPYKKISWSIIQINIKSIIIRAWSMNCWVKSQFAFYHFARTPEFLIEYKMLSDLDSLEWVEWCGPHSNLCRVCYTSMIVGFHIHYVISIIG